MKTSPLLKVRKVNFKTINNEITISHEGNVITLTRPSESKDHRSIHGTTRSLLSNMVAGVSKGFERTLELLGLDIVLRCKGETCIERRIFTSG